LFPALGSPVSESDGSRLGVDDCGRQREIRVDAPRLIEDLYEGTLDPTVWERAVLGIVDSVRASGAILFAFNPSTGAVLRNENHRVDPHVVEDYRRYWTFEDFRLSHVLAMPTGQPATEVSLSIPLKGTRLYHEYLLPVDMPHFLPVWLHKSKEKVVSLSIQGSHKRGAFDRQDVETIEKILPHFARAFEIRDRLEAAEVRAATFSSLLDATTFGVIVLNRNLKILEANAVASAIFKDGAGLQRGPDGALLIRCRDADRLFRPKLPNTACRGSADAVLHVPRGGGLPLSVMVLPVPALHASWISGEPAWVLLVFDPERRLAISQLVVMSDLGLSEREAQVASLLAAGLQMHQIAKRLHITVHTVRSQLKSAFQKTDCHTQAQLVRRLLLGPALASRMHASAPIAHTPDLGPLQGH
jgi:DNA-binding CsgD family transcriptional regulator/PAS domain-containing protein